MRYLIIVSVIWALSFGLIKTYLAGMNPYMVAWIRLILSFIIFLPFLRVRMLGSRSFLALLGIGAIQYGVMYISYITSYRFLMSYQVALFTVLTPIYVSIYSDIRSGRFRLVYMASALLAVLGAAIVKYNNVPAGAVLAGFLLVQVSNISFAIGQIEYKRVMSQYNGLKDSEVFGVLYLGAVLLAVVPIAVNPALLSVHAVTLRQILVLVYLGILPSGICFFLWNKGARTVNVGTLAVMNNVKIPLAVLCSLAFFGETTSVLRLVMGGVIMAAALSVVRVDPERSEA